MCFQKGLSKRRASLPLRGLLAVLVLAACDAGSTDPSVIGSTAVEIRVDRAELVLPESDTAIVTAAAVDANGREVGAKVTWSSSDVAVAVIDSAGQVLARRAGSTELVAEHVREDGRRIRASVVVRVHRSRGKIELYETPYVRHVMGGTYTYRFRVVDTLGVALPGLRVRFGRVGPYPVIVSPAEAITDSLGVVSTNVTYTAVVWQSIEVRADGVAPFQVGDLPIAGVSIGLTPDPLVVMEGCAGRIWADVWIGGQSTLGQTVNFHTSDTTVLSLARGGGTGSVRGHAIYATGKRLGTALVIGEFLNAAYDTVAVTVVASAPSSMHASMGLFSALGIGGANFVNVVLSDDCSRAFELPDLAARSLDPEVAEVDSVVRRVTGVPGVPRGAVWVRGRAPGTARIEVRTGSFVDTVQVEVEPFRMLPADTTVGVGATVQFRMAHVGTGAEPDRVFTVFYAAPSGAPHTITTDGLLTATSPGRARVGGQLGIRSGDGTKTVYLDAMITVVDAPGASGP